MSLTTNAADTEHESIFMTKPMHRKAQFTLAPEELTKLVLGAIALIGVLYMCYSLIGIFTKGQTDYTAKRNLEIIDKRIQLAQKSGERVVPVVVNFPDRYFLVAFSPERTSYTLNFEPSYASMALWMNGLMAAGGTFAPLGGAVFGYGEYKRQQGDYTLQLDKPQKTWYANDQCEVSCLCVYHLDIRLIDTPKEKRFHPVACKEFSFPKMHAYHYADGKPYVMELVVADWIAAVQ